MNPQSWLETVVVTAVTLSPIVSFLVAVIKTTAGESLYARYYPVVSVATGIAAAAAVSWGSGLLPMREALLAGAISGGIASGLFAWGKSKETVTPYE